MKEGNFLLLCTVDIYRTEQMFHIVQLMQSLNKSGMQRLIWACGGVKSFPILENMKVSLEDKERTLFPLAKNFFLFLAQPPLANSLSDHLR